MIAPAEPLIEWPQPLLEYAGFVAAFLTSGSVGFRYAVLRPLMRASVEPTFSMQVRGFPLAPWPTTHPNGASSWSTR